MAIDKALNQAPLGLAAIDPEQEGPDLEIIIEGEESDVEEVEEDEDDDSYWQERAWEANRD